ncbi:MAG: hypothetical protein NNA23_00585 [Nitrospira sp.]|nr:hypothetical protein [Nitrospira sp.]
MTVTAVETIARVRLALEQLGTDCAIEEVVGLCPDLTWNQVFLAIDYLSRTGQVRISLDQHRTYRVQATPAPEDHQIQASTGLLRLNSVQ